MQEKRLSYFFNGDSQEQAFLVVRYPERIEPKAERVSTFADPLLHDSIRGCLNASERNIKNSEPNTVRAVSDVTPCAGYACLDRSHQLSTLFINSADGSVPLVQCPNRTCTSGEESRLRSHRY